jgi:FtsH-binding integral membrane protein|mmetsp:Transcript_15554/g.24868  ORF Transcript_15554/g.24868 Transcript_15554/m.24868 type:complete len:249 (-) Transcript_15554:110-856(-)
MQAFDRLTNPPSFDIGKLTNFSALEPKVQKHLKNVYTALCGLLALAAAGVAAQIKYQVDIMFCGLAALGVFFWLLWTPHQPHNPEQEKKRFVLLGLFGFLKGTTLGPLIQMNLKLQPELIGVAFGGTAAVFACFSIAAMCAKRRSYLYLFGFLSSAVSLMCLLSFANMFMRSSSIYLFQVYGGLVVFSLYVIYDTQLIIEKAACMAPDVIRDACELFMDFIAIFVRILIILMRNNDKRRRDKDRDSRR